MLTPPQPNQQSKKQRNRKKVTPKRRKPNYRLYQKPKSASELQAKALRNAPRRNLSEDTIRYIETLTNPFGSQIDSQFIGARVPDGSGLTHLIKLTGHLSFNNGDRERFIVALQPPSCDGSIGFIATTDWVSSKSNALTAFSAIACEQSTALTALLNDPHSLTNRSIRIVASGIRANMKSSDTSNAGVVRGFVSDVNPYDTGGGSPVYVQNGAYTDGFIEEPHSLTLNDGITVRGYCDNYTFHEANTLMEEYCDIPLPCGRLPGIACHLTGGYIEIDIVMYVEVRAPSDALMTPMSSAAPDPDLTTIIGYCNALEHVVEGHSFKSFIKKVKNIIGKGVGFYHDNANWIDPLVGTVKKLIL